MRRNLSKQLKGIEQEIKPKQELTPLIEKLGLEVALSVCDTELLKRCVGRYGEAYQEDATQEIVSLATYYKQLITSYKEDVTVERLILKCDRQGFLQVDDCLALLHHIEPNKWACEHNKIILKEGIDHGRK